MVIEGDFLLTTVWTQGYLDFTTVTWKVMWRRVDLEGPREIITRRGRAFLALAASTRDGTTGSHLSCVSACYRAFLIHYDLDI